MVTRVWFYLVLITAFMRICVIFSCFIVICVVENGIGQRIDWGFALDWRWSEPQ
jgi:hypothetical protein